MRVPLSWLKRLVPNTLSSAAIAEALTVAGIEVDGVQGIGVYAKQVVCAVLLSVQRLPEHPQVWLLAVDVGAGAPITIITTAASAAAFAVGTRMAVALAGAVLIQDDAHAFTLREVTADTRYGHVSAGVLCSARDLGIGETDTVFCPDASAVPGTPLATLLTPAATWVADQVLELAILANIARCQSLYGVAREVAALTQHTLTAVAALVEKPSQLTALTPHIAAPEVCRRFALATLCDVIIQPSPQWLQRELVLAGIRPINNVVDAGNYVMLELGQPMHVYDADRLHSSELTVRWSQTGDTLHALTQTADSAPLVLAAGHLVIADAQQQVVALAGVVGGSATAVQAATQRIVVEAANFDLITVRRSQAAHKIITESSLRFSRGVDPSLPLNAIQRFIYLLQQTCPAVTWTGLGDTSSGVLQPRQIALRAQEVNAALGLDLSIETIAHLLQRVGIACVVDAQQGVLCAEIGTQREDIQESCDLLEEVARLYGYDKLPATLPSQALTEQLLAPELVAREQLRDAWVRSGLQEVLSYSMTTPEVEARLLVAATEPVESPAYVCLLNPISEERTVLRRSLLPGLLQTVQFNLRFAEACHVFEIGRVFLPEVAGDSPLLPSEPYRLAAVMTGAVQPASWHDAEPRAVDFYDIAGIVQETCALLRVPHLTLEPATQPMFRTGACAAITQRGTVCGYVGIVHDEVALAFGVEDRIIVALELDADVLLAARETAVMMQPIWRFPSITLDISIEVLETITMQQIVQVIRRAGGLLLQEVQLFDLYRANQLGEGKKALALHLLFNAQTRTLTMQEACAVRDVIVTQLHQDVGAKLRDA